MPDSYGNSYFWVKPDRIVPLHLVQEVDERLDRTGAVVREFDEDGAREVARWLREQGIACVGVCFLHAYMNPEHERRMRDVLAEEHPDCAVSLSSDVLSEYREYERAVTTLVDAFVKPLRGRLRALDRGPARPAVLRHEEQRRRDRGAARWGRSRSRRSSPARPRARWARRSSPSRRGSTR